jgi:hypothetical protein
MRQQPRTKLVQRNRYLLDGPENISLAFALPLIRLQ